MILDIAMAISKNGRMNFINKQLLSMLINILFIISSLASKGIAIRLKKY
jgi:hypothetical protein